MDHPHAFDKINDAIPFVVGSLPRELPQRLRFAVAHNFVLFFDDGFVDEWPRASAPVDIVAAEPEFGARFEYCRDTYAIRPGDVRELGGLLLAGAGLGTAEESRPAVALAIFGLSAFWGLRRLLTMGADLSPIQRQVLLTLRKRGPLALDDLVMGAIAFGREWSKDDVAGALEELRSKELRDHRVVALVEQNSAGLWFTDARGLWELPVGVSDVYEL